MGRATASDRGRFGHGNSREESTRHRTISFSCPPLRQGSPLHARQFRQSRYPRGRRREPQDRPVGRPREARLRPFSPPLRAQDPAREPAAPRGRQGRHRRGDRLALPLGPGGRSRRARSPSCRRACCCRTSPASPPWSTSPRCATRWRRMGGDPDADQPAPAGRAGHRPLGAGRRVRQRGGAAAQRRRSSSATTSATPSCAGARTRSTTSGRAAGDRHRAPGEPRVPGAGGDGERARAGPIPTPWSAPTRTPR